MCKPTPSALSPHGSLFRDPGPYRDLFDHLGPYFYQRSLFFLFWAHVGVESHKSQACMPAICIQCPRLCEVEFILVYFVRLLLITPSFSTCFLLTTFGWIRAFVANLVVSSNFGFLNELAAMDFTLVRSVKMHKTKIHHSTVQSTELKCTTTCLLVGVEGHSICPVCKWQKFQLRKSVGS